MRKEYLQRKGGRGRNTCRGRAGLEEGQGEKGILAEEGRGEEGRLAEEGQG